MHKQHCRQGGGPQARSGRGLNRIAAMAGLLALAVAAAASPSGASGLPAAGVTVITGVTVVAMDGAPVREDQTLVVRGNTIETLGAAGAVRPPAGARVIDGRGKFLIPGLVDMHAHVIMSGGDDLKLFLSQGVTTIRNMAEAPDPRVRPDSFQAGLDFPSGLRLRADVAGGKVIGPRIIQAGHVLDGPVAFDPRVTVAHPAGTDWAAVVAGEKAAGYDYLKVYWNLEPAQFDAILAESRRQGIKAIGHVPFAVDIEAAIAAGLYSNEHLTGFYEYENILPRLDGIIAATARSGMWNCPTLIGLATILPPGDEAFAARQQRPEMRYVPGRIKERWVKDSVTWGTVMPPAGKFMDYFYMIAKSLSDGGCNLVAGSDCNMPWVVPGFSLHEELGQLQAAGLSPLAALKAATADAGRCLGRSDIGVIRPGAAADLVLLDADPRLSSAACARISGVMAGGTWYDRAALDGLLAGVAARAK